MEYVKSFDRHGTIGGMVQLSAILPKNGTRASAGLAGMRSILDTFGFEGQRRLQKYPAAQPWKGPTPKSGLRKGGRRTGTLGRNWKLAAKSKYSITIQNMTPYGVHVQGPPDGPRGARQTANMAARGWPNVKTVGEDVKDLILKTGRIYVD